MSANIIITIAEPCHQNWDNMTQQQQGKFCSSCAKTVTDFTNKTNQEIATIISTLGNNACGRFNNTSLNKPIAQSLNPLKIIPAKPYKNWSYFKYIFSLIFIVKTANIKAQTTQHIIMGKIISRIPTKIDTLKKQPAIIQAYKINITDEAYNPIQSVTVGFTNGSGIINKINNNIFFIAPDNKNFTVTIKAQGYKVATINANNIKTNIILIKEVATLTSVRMGEIAINYTNKTNESKPQLCPKVVPNIEPEIVVKAISQQSHRHIMGAMSIVSSRHLTSTAGIKQKQPKIINRAFIIYPNVVKPTTSFNVKFTSPNAQQLMVAILSIEGKFLQTTPLTAIKGNNIFSVALKPNIAPQIGIVKLMDAKGKWLGSQQIIIE